jgi:prefoldin subunit 5
MVGKIVLKLKIAEYNQLQAEIEELNQEVQRLITKT